MDRKYILLFLIGSILLTVSSGCSNPHRRLPVPRPSGKELVTFQPPSELSPVSLSAPETRDPEDTLTLSQVWSLALLKNPELAGFAWEVRVKEASAIQKGLLPNPELGVEVEEFGGTRDLSGFKGAQTTIALSQLLELGGKRSKRTAVAVLETDLAGWDYEAKRLDVLTEATKTFVEVLAAQEKLILTDELVRLTEDLFNAVSGRVQAGKVAPVEETKAGVALSSSKIERERARRALEAARKRLALIWGSSSPAFERAGGELDVIFTIPSEETLSSLISQNPDVARWLVENEQRRAALELEKAGRIPDLTLSGGVRRFNETDDNAFVMGVSVPIPLFDRNQGGILEAGSRLAQAEKGREAAEASARAALAEAYQALATAFSEAITLRDDVVPRAQDAFEAAQEGYRQGKFGFLDVLDAQRTLIETRGQYLEALESFHKAKTDVERLIGQGLDNLDQAALQKSEKVK